MLARDQTYREPNCGTDDNLHSGDHLGGSESAQKV